MKNNNNLSTCPKVKILISYKEEHSIIKSDIIIPIQTGRAISDKIFDEMIGDDSGDNISEKNEDYAELTAQYWAWKNYEKIGSPEYIGFMHYRRHFIFNENYSIIGKTPWYPNMPVYLSDYDQQSKDNLNDNYILKTIKDNADCYSIEPYDINCFKESDLYMKEHYLMTIPGSKRCIWNLFYNTVLNLYPEYKRVLNNFVYGSKMYVCNMFILRKELFFRFSEFSFSILKKIREIINLKYPNYGHKYLGYIGEYLLTLFIMKIYDEKKTIRHLKALLFKTIDSPQRLPKEQECFSIPSLKWGTRIIKLVFLPIRKVRKVICNDLRNVIHNEIESCNNAIWSLIMNSQKQEETIKMLLVKISELQEELYITKKEKNNDK